MPRLENACQESTAKLETRCRRTWEEECDVLRACAPPPHRGALSSLSTLAEGTDLCTAKLVRKLEGKAAEDRCLSISIAGCKLVGRPAPAHQRQKRFPRQHRTRSSSCFTLQAARVASSFPRFRRAFVVQVRGPPPVRKCHVPRGFDTDHVSELLTNTRRIATSKEEARARATKEASETTKRKRGGRMEGGNAHARPSTSLEAAGNEAMVQVGRHGATCRRKKLSHAWRKVPNARQLCLFVLQQGVDRTRAMLVRTIQRIQSTAPVLVVDVAKRPSVRLVLWCACTYAAGRIVLEVMTWSRNVLDVMRARQKLEWEMAQAVDFCAWAKAAAALDALRGPGREEEEDFYDQGLLKERLEHLQRVRQEGNVNEMAFALRCDQPRNLGNITNKAIHETRRVGVPETIREYIEEVKMQLKYLTNYPLPDVTPDEKLQFLAETRHGHGRTALVLSGGGALGVFHLGVVHALLQKGLLPRIMAGSSVGALICAIVATKTDAELEGTFNSGALTQMELTFFKHSGTTSLLKQMMKTGTLQDHSYFQEQLRSILGDYTFQEAYDHSGRILNISVSPTSIKEPCRVLNYLTAPHVLIWSAVAASSAFPGLFPSTVLMAKAIDGRFVEYTPEAGRGEERMWRDGSLRVDLPMRTLSELFNVNYFIVSQTNPHITPFLRLKRRLNWLRVPFASTVFRLLELEWKHRCKQLRFLIPRSFRGIQWLFTLGSQDWEGDVTIVMPTTWSQYAKIVYNPTREELSETMLQGMRATWEKLSAIEANCGIELTLDECMQSLKHEKMEVRRRRKPRIPSWFTFSGTLGHALSHDSGSEDGDP